jgi:hypothetical protein
LLKECLAKSWGERLASAPIDEVMRFSEAGLLLGAGTVLAPSIGRGEVRLEGREPRLLALLAAAHRRAPAAGSLTHLRKAAQRWNEGEADLAAIHLALSGVSRLGKPRADAQRLFLADGLLEAGLAASAIFDALGLGSSNAKALSKYSPNQPRVPAGSGRASGEWTSAGTAAPVEGRPAARRAATARRAAAQGPHQTPKPLAPTGRTSPPLGPRPSGGDRLAVRTRTPAPHIPAGAIAIGGPVEGIDLAGMTAGAVARLAAFVAGVEGVSALAAGAAWTAGLGVLFFPEGMATSKWVNIGGPGNISYFRSLWVAGLTLRYTGADGVQRTLGLAPGPDGGERDPSGRTVARWTKIAGKMALLISLAALPGLENDGPQLCPNEEKDRPGGDRGRAYEDFVKKLFNPDRPTPSGFAYKFLDPVTGNAVMIDDCQWETGVLAEYKGPNFAHHLLKNDPVWRGMEKTLTEQAIRQVQAKGNRHLIWIVDERPLAAFLTLRFRKLDLPIEVEWLPMSEAD